MREEKCYERIMLKDKALRWNREKNNRKMLKDPKKANRPRKINILYFSQFFHQMKQANSSKNLKKLREKAWVSVGVCVNLTHKEESIEQKSAKHFWILCVYFIGKRANKLRSERVSGLNERGRQRYFKESTIRLYFKRLKCFFVESNETSEKKLFILLDSFVKCLAFMTPSTYLKRFESWVLYRSRSRYNPTRHQATNGNAKVSSSLTHFFYLTFFNKLLTSVCFVNPPNRFFN